MPRTPPPCSENRAAKFSPTPTRSRRPGSGLRRLQEEAKDAGTAFAQPEPLAPVQQLAPPARTVGRGRGNDGAKSPSPLPLRPRDFHSRRPSTASPCSDDDEGAGALTLIGRLRSLGENKIYGLREFCNKVALGLALNFVAELFEDLMPWWPTTFILPRDMQEATAAMHKKDKTGKPVHTFIFKPDSTFGGNGVCLVQSGDALHSLMQRKYSCAVLQEYITRPLLIDGLKWDCRVYVLVTSVSPLRVYVAREGLARFCTELYHRPSAENLEAMFSHVTNYTLNKMSPAYQESEGDPTGGHGSKRSLSVVLERLAKLSPTFTTEQFWAEVDHIVAMTMLVLQPELIHKAAVRKSDADYQAGGDSPSFHMLGFDILLDSNERASLLELNANPSLSTQSGGYNPITGRLEINTCAVDEAVKTAVVDGACSIIEQQTTCGSTADTASAEPFHRLDIWQHPEYLRVRQLLQRLGRLLQYSLRSETAVGERDTGLGCARFCRFVKDAGLLTVRPERLKGGSIGTVVPALTPNIVEFIFKSVISSGGKTAVKSQPEYTKLGLLLRELARHQLSHHKRRAITPQQPAVDLLEKSTKTLELLLGTTDVTDKSAATAAASVEKSEAEKQAEDPIEQAARNATITLGRMSQLVQELENRKAPLQAVACETTGLLPSPKRTSIQGPRAASSHAREQPRKVGATFAAASTGAPAVQTEGATARLRLPHTPPGGTLHAEVGQRGRLLAKQPLWASTGGVSDSRAESQTNTRTASSGESNSRPPDSHGAGMRSPHSQMGSEQRAERRRQTRDEVLGRQGNMQPAPLRELSKMDSYRPTSQPQIKMERMTWSVPELDSAPVRCKLMVVATSHPGLDRPSHASPTCMHACMQRDPC